MGRHCGPRFWCGFCVEIIEISAIERGGNSWTKRCDHIDNHLFGKEGLEKKDISEWRYQEDEQDAIKEVDFLAVPGSDVDMAGGKKRKSTEDIDVRPFKKPSGDETYMWNCVSTLEVPPLRVAGLTTLTVFLRHHHELQDVPLLRRMWTRAVLDKLHGRASRD